MADRKAVLERVVIGDMVEKGRRIARAGDLVFFTSQVASGDITESPNY